MRLSLRGDNLLERLVLRTGLVPAPAAEAWGGMALSAMLVTAVELGVFSRLATGPASAEELRAELDLAAPGLAALLDCLHSGGYLRLRGGRYELTRVARRWLAPQAPLSVADFVAGTGDYWTWWQRLPEVIRTGTPVGHHDADPDDPYWRRYLTGQYQLARLSAGEVARKLRVPPHARTVLDIGGGHGAYPIELCRRHPALTATVLDLPGSARIGRELVAAAGLADRISFREGDARHADLGAGYDLVLCFNLVHHLTPAEIVALFTRIRAALAPGGSLAVLDGFSAPTRRPQPAAATLSLFMYLSSGSRAYPRDQLGDWLSRAGFAAPRRIPARRIPGLALYQAAT